MSPLPPTVQEKFHPDKLLAEGGFGAVWLTTQVALGRAAAVKVLHPRVLADSEQVSRFRREAKVTSRLAHPNIVVVIDHGIDDGIPWIAYEFVEGESLRGRISNRGIPWTEACRIMDQVLQALEAAHEAGVLHRDIKPDNILESGPGHYKVADFGIAKWAGDHTLPTVQGVILGTPAYISPVQIRGETPAPESDLYAVAVTLFELIAGRVPFEAEGPVEMLQQHLMRTPPLLSTFAPDVPPVLDRLIERALSKKREDRFESASAFREALNRVLEPVITPVPEVRPSAATLAVSSRALQKKGVTKVSSRWTGSLVATVALGLLLLALSFRDRSSPAPSAPAIFFSEPRFSGLDTVRIEVAPALPPGATLTVEDERGRRLACDFEHTGGTIRLGGLPPSTPCRLMLRAPGSDRADEVRAFATPAREELVGARFLEGDDRVQLTMCGLRSEHIVELSTGQGSPWVLKGKLAAGSCRSIVIEGLKPDTPYWIRAFPAVGWGGLDRHRVGTRSAARGDDVRRFEQVVTRGSSSEHEAGLLFLGSIEDDPRLGRVLMKVLESGNGLSAQVLQDIAGLAIPLADPGLAQALVSRLGSTDDPRIASLILSAACTAGLPGADRLAFEHLASARALDRDQDLLVTMRHAGMALKIEDVGLLLRANHTASSPDLAALLLRSGRKGLGRKLRQWLEDPQLDAATRQFRANTVRYALAVLDEDEIRSFMHEPILPEIRLVVDGSLTGAMTLRESIGACEWLDKLGPGDPGSIAVAKAFLECPGGLAALHELGVKELDELVVPGPMDPISISNRIRDLAGLDVLRAEDAAWLLARGNVREAVGPLLQRVRRGADRRGVAVWALGMLRAPEAGELVRRELELSEPPDLDGWGRRGLAAWAASELELRQLEPRIVQLWRDERAPSFARYCAEDALTWLRHPDGPRRWLVVHGMTAFRTDRRLAPGASADIRVAVLRPLGPAGEPDVEAFVGAGFFPLQMGLNRVLSTDTAHGPLLFGRMGPPDPRNRPAEVSDELIYLAVDPLGSGPR